MCINYQRGMTFTLSLNSSRKYYYVQLATGVSQWELPSATSLTAESASNNSKQAASPHNMPKEAQGSDSKDQGRGCHPEKNVKEMGIDALARTMLHMSTPDQKERYLASLKHSYPEAYETAYTYSDPWYFILRQKASLELHDRGGKHYVFKRGELDQIAASSLQTLIWAGTYEQET
jgi:hypothetical protein